MFLSTPVRQIFSNHCISVCAYFVIERLPSTPGVCQYCLWNYMLYIGLNIFISKIIFMAITILLYSILFYPITLEGRRGTTDEFATIPFHLDLFSAALVELAKSIPVHSLMLSSHLFFCLPLFLFPFTVP